MYRLTSLSSKWMVVWVAFVVVMLLTACQGGVNHGTSSHVAVGATSYPLDSERPVARRDNPVPQGPATQARSNPALANPAAVKVKVVAANPQQGIPLGDAAPVEVENLRPATQPKATPVPAKTSSTAEPVGASAAAGTWLERYPNLAADLHNYQEVITNLEQEAQAYNQQMRQLQQEVAKNWRGSPMISTSAHQFVKYTDAYQSRGAMDFDSGKVVVETVDANNPKLHLQEAIVTTLLTPFDADNPETFSAKKISYSGPALLAGQVIDNEGQPVKWQWRAERYAKYLVDNKMQTVAVNGQTVYRVEIPLIANHNQVRGQQYENLVREAAQRYQVEEALIYAIMETESHFNPYATSHVPAYGLMQIVPATAGKDVFTRIKKRNDQPSRNYLFNPANNIDTGVAYISILRDNYLQGIRNPLAREYAIISGYNGGAGNVLRTFHTDRQQAVNIINQLSPQQVYERLHLRHPSAESRGYIKKVTQAQQKYRTLARQNN